MIVLFRDYTGSKKCRPTICGPGAFDGFRRFGERCAPASERCWDIWKLLAVDASLVNVGVRVQTTQCFTRYMFAAWTRWEDNGFGGIFAKRIQLHTE